MSLLRKGTAASSVGGLCSSGQSLTLRRVEAATVGRCSADLHRGQGRRTPTGHGDQPPTAAPEQEQESVMSGETPSGGSAVTRRGGRVVPKQHTGEERDPAKARPHLLLIGLEIWEGEGLGWIPLQRKIACKRKCNFTGL